MRKILTAIVLGLLVLGACKSDKQKRGLSDDFEIPDSVLYKGELEVSEQAMEEIVQNVSSPVEMAALIKSIGVPFSKDYLATTDYADNYNTSFKKALGLGIFGADLGYLNMYNKTGQVIDYISTIKQLADGIHVGQFFDFSTLKRLATNNQNLDSLMYISVQNFNQMDRYLRENNRGKLSSLIIAGIWVESMYLLSGVVEERPDSQQLKEKIGEQKIILGNLMLLLNNYKRDAKFQKIITDFEEIAQLYEGVKITYEKGEPQAVEEDGMLVIKQTDRQFVEMSDELLFQIIEKVKKMRNDIIIING
ncbi:MAG: hypothetical protein ACQESW_09175 [Bacteroidota bacterium]